MISNAVTHLVGVYQKGQSISLYTNGVLATNMSIPNDTLETNLSGYALASALGIYDYTPSPYKGFRGQTLKTSGFTQTLSRHYKYKNCINMSPSQRDLFQQISSHCLFRSNISLYRH